MVNKMVERKRLITCAGILTLAIVVIYSCNCTYYIEPFFSILLSHPKAHIDDLCGIGHYALRCIFVQTPVALDAKGHIYILGRKKGRVKILVLNREGKIERTIIPRLKDGHPLEESPLLLSVSPSGNFIWTVKIERIGVRLTVHDRNGKAKMDWLLNTDVINHLALNAYSDEGAYLVGTEEFVWLRLGRKEPQKFNSENFHPPYPPFFHNGRYWGIIELKWLIPKMDHLKFKEQIKRFKIKEDLFGVVTWSPREGTRLLSVIKFQGPVGVALQWIDKQGNFYTTAYGYTSLYWSLPSWAREGIWGERIIKILKALRLYDRFRKLEQHVIVRIFSPRGELRDVIRLSQVIRPRRGEKWEYGQLVKVDERGIYWEVEKVNEPREYRIVRITKKPRWQVWWETLRSWFSPDDI